MDPGTCTYRLVPGDPQQTLGYPLQHFYFLHLVQSHLRQCSFLQISNSTFCEILRSFETMVMPVDSKCSGL